MGFTAFYHDPMPHDPNCPLCKAVADPDRIWAERLIWRFPHSFAILGPWQYYTGYCVLISREHATELSKLGPHRAAFLEEMSILSAAIEACFAPHKLNYELLGNLVPHLHWHLFPRSADDGEKLRPVVRHRACREEPRREGAIANGNRAAPGMRRQAASLAPGERSTNVCLVQRLSSG